MVLLGQLHKGDEDAGERPHTHGAPVHDPVRPQRSMKCVYVRLWLLLDAPEPRVGVEQRAHDVHPLAVGLLIATQRKGGTVSYHERRNPARRRSKSQTQQREAVPEPVLAYRLWQRAAAVGVAAVEHSAPAAAAGL